MLNSIDIYKKQFGEVIQQSNTILLIGRFDASAYKKLTENISPSEITVLDFSSTPNISNPPDPSTANLRIVYSDVVDYMKTVEKSFDLCIWQNSVEQYPYEEFIEFLRYAFQKISYLMVTTLDGGLCFKEEYQKYFQNSRFIWRKHNWENLGFNVCELNVEIADPLKDFLIASRKLKNPIQSNQTKIFVYPNARTQTHDKINDLWDTIPMCIEGLNKHFQIVTDPTAADLLFMGMISCGTVHEFKESDFKYLRTYPEKHIFEMEGDWTSNYAPPWLSKITRSGNTSKPENMKGLAYIRPVIGNFLTYLAKDNPEYELQFPAEKTWCFRGFPDPFGTRVRIMNLMNRLKIPGNYSLTNKFGAGQDLSSENVRKYYSLLYTHLISLCPEGAGADTIRFYETCFFGRVPVVIGNSRWIPRWLNDDQYDMSFVYTISPALPDDQIAQTIMKIHNEPYEQLVERGRLARKYFQEVVVEYFKDPTQQFINFLKKNGVMK